MLPDPLFLNVHMYGIMIAVGLLAAFSVLTLYSKKLGISEKLVDFVYYNGIASIVVGFGAAAIFQGLYDYIENPSLGFRLDGGITFIGGLIGGAGCFLLVYAILRKRLSLRLIDILSVIPCSITIAHAFGRVGCFFAGCCYGVRTDSPLGVKFPDLPYPVHATQLYEAIFLVILFGVCSFLLFRYRFAHNLSVYLVAYGVFRFAIEYLRGDERGQFLGILSPSQFWSILMIVIGLACIPLVNELRRRRAEEIALAEAAANDSEHE